MANKASQPGNVSLSSIGLQANNDTQDPSPHAYSPEFVLEDASSVYKADLRFNSLMSHKEQLSAHGQIGLSWHTKHRLRDPPVLESIHYRRYLEEAGAFLELPRSTTDALLPIYNAILDDLIPVVDGASVLRDHSNAECSIYLVRALCLAVCKTKQAVPFLRLSPDGPVMEPLNFALTLSEGLDVALKADLEPDRLVKVQILALLHLHNHGPAGIERSPSYLSQAICEAWSISLHVIAPPKPDQEQCDYLWWTLRNFDRLNKPIARAGPFMIDDTDIGILRPAARIGSYRSQLMEMALLLGDLMVTATKSYKASSTATTDGCEVFPSLSDIVSSSRFDQFHRSHKAYLKIWYHVAAMLTSRYSDPQSIQYNRRLKSAYEILDIFVQENYQSLPPLPLLPYAISMSTTVIYRAWRDGERDLNDTYKNLGMCCSVLEGLEQVWRSARNMALLAVNLRNAMKPDSANQGGRRNSPSHRIVSPASVTAPTHGDNAANLGQNALAPIEEEEVPESFWAGLERACVQFDATFDNLLDYEAFCAFQETIPVGQFHQMHDV
ncbi:hypothetical protein BJY04DRAFT_215811 [Aspergillus karnatakaensis]|uniref:fungal specific transcription factor domain-containing protein n=1 Tax=Aspergillus karnatakaensis TaxID=1810916 RepID=UPI003CCDFDD2